MISPHLLPQAADDPTARFYDRISRAYDLIADASERSARELGLRALAVSPGLSVLRTARFHVETPHATAIWGLPVVAAVGAKLEEGAMR